MPTRTGTNNLISPGSLSVNRTDSYKRDIEREREKETWKRINHEPTATDGYKRELWETIDSVSFEKGKSVSRKANKTCRKAIKKGKHSL